MTPWPKKVSIKKIVKQQCVSDKREYYPKFIAKTKLLVAT